MDKQYLVPGSILLGCAMIAGGLYFGLRGRPTAQEAGPPAGQGQLVVSPQPGGPLNNGVGATLPPPPPPGATADPAPQGAPAAAGLTIPATHAEVQARGAAAAKVALEAEKKATFLPKCWEPALRTQPSPAKAKFVFDMTFDPSGKEIARGISEDRSAARSDVATCLRSLPMGLQIAAPGVSVRVELPVELP